MEDFYKMANRYSGKSEKDLLAERQRLGKIRDRGGPGAKDIESQLNEVTQALHNASRAAKKKTNGYVEPVPKDVKDEFAKADAEAERQGRENNPNQVNPWGSQEVTRDANGNVIVKQTLTPEQEAIRQRDDQISQAGRDAAARQLGSGNFDTPFVPQTSARSSGADFLADRARIEEAIYSKFTRGIDDKERQDRAEFDQKLRNEGIQFSDDPKSAYQKRLRSLVTDRYDTARENARQTAIQQGGEEYKTDFGIQEQRIANEYSQGMGTHKGQLGDIETLSKLGPGVHDQSYQGYIPAGFDPVAWAQLSEAEKRRIQDAAIAKMQDATNRQAISQREASAGAATQPNPAFGGGL